MNIVYCSKCKEVLSVGGALPASHRTGTETHSSPPIGSKDSSAFPVRAIVVENEARLPGEGVAAFFVRMRKKHAAKFG
jgi:hypothetical protein